MRITKLGHCCLVIEITAPASEESPLEKGVPNSDSGRVVLGTPSNNPPRQPPFLRGIKGDKPVRIMTDPGAYSTLQNEAKDIDFIFITHEHSDHCHIESLKTVLKNNPNAKIITNKGVGKLLDAEGISYQLLEHGGIGNFGGVSVEGHGEKHAVNYQEAGLVQNTGYFFANRFFYPGDAFCNPQKPVEILALPVAGGWLKTAEVVEYAKVLKPRIAFPVHDGMLKIFGGYHAIPQKFLPPAGIEFKVLELGKAYDFR